MLGGRREGELMGESMVSAGELQSPVYFDRNVILRFTADFTRYEEMSHGLGGIVADGRRRPVAAVVPQLLDDTPACSAAGRCTLVASSEDLRITWPGGGTFFPRSAGPERGLQPLLR